MSVPYFGDFIEDSTVYIPFNTFSSDDPQASVTITNLVDADLKVHKDGGLTQIATDGATISIDFDTVTGNHLATIDTSASADYSVGSDYMVRMEGTTVDGATINAWIGTFSIENRFNGANTTALSKLEQYFDAAETGTAQAGAAGSITLAAGASATTDFFKHAWVFISGGTGAGQGRKISTYNGTTKVATVVDNWTINPDSTSVYLIIPDGTSIIDSSNPIDANVEQWNGTAVETPATAGVPNVNTEYINNASVVGDGNATPWDGA